MQKKLILALILGVVLVGIFFKATEPSPKIIDSQPKNVSHQVNNFINKIRVATVSAEASKSASKSATVVALPSNSGHQVTVPILTYHYIGNNPNPKDTGRDALEVTPDKFDEQMAYISKNGYSTISLDTLYAALKGGLLPSKPIILTFDDGYIDFYTNAYPILKKYGLRATAFIPTGLMNQGYYMSWDQIKEIDSGGLVSLEAHSVTHANLTSVSDEQLRYQLSQSKSDLEAHLGKKINFMAYPYGISDPRVWQATKVAGYLGSVGTYYGIIESEGNIFDMPRIKISGSWSIEEFSRRI